MALLHHPDVNKEESANTLFLLVNQAYTVLSDEGRRKKYDSMLKYGFKSTVVNAPQSPFPSKFEEDKGRKYGTKHKFDPAEGQKKKSRYSKKDIRQFELIETAMFYSLMGIGIIAIYMAAHDLYYNEWEGFNSLSGLIFGFSFTLLLFYVWFQFYRRNRRNR
jgi:curved DNA-binding protein CbpA